MNKREALALAWWTHRWTRLRRIDHFRQLRCDGFTVPQAARYLEVSDRTGWRYEAAIKLGGPVMFCDDTAPEDWLEQFAGRCYFYPGRDCPGWAPGRLCSRIERRIPDAH